MTRLSVDVVKKQISDMWDALDSGPRDEGYSKACEEASRIELDLLAKLTRQHKLDLHSEELRDALRLILDHGTRTVDGDNRPLGVNIEGCHVVSQRFEKAWLGAIKVLEKIEGE